MTLFPAIVVFSLVFLFFSKDVFAEEKPKEKMSDKTKPSASDVLLKYKLLEEFGEKS